MIEAALLGGVKQSTKAEPSEPEWNPWLGILPTQQSMKACFDDPTAMLTTGGGCYKEIDVIEAATLEVAQGIQLMEGGFQAVQMPTQETDYYTAGEQVTLYASDPTANEVVVFRPLADTAMTLDHPVIEAFDQCQETLNTGECFTKIEDDGFLQWSQMDSKTTVVVQEVNHPVMSVKEEFMSLD